MAVPEHRAAGRAGPRPAVIPLVVGVCGLTLLLSFLDKNQCTGPTFDAFGVSTNFTRLKNSNFCYTDIQQLWIGRGIREHLFPYIHGRLDGDQLVGGTVEYPVLTGLFMWFTGLFARNDAEFLFVSALFLAPFGLLTARLLAGLTGRRALIWAAAPALVFYAFLNWDLMVTAAFATAVWCWWRGRNTAAAAWLGVGSALKLYPAIFVLPLVAARLRAKDWRGAAGVVGASAGTFAAVNLPFVLANPRGWWATYAFQSMRGADITTNSIWYWGFPGIPPDTLNVLTAALILLSWAGALVAGWWLAGHHGGYPWLQVAGAMLSAFLLFNKVHSPQYMLWLLPFFVLIRVRWGWWVTYMVFDALLFVGLFSWYQTITEGGDFGLAKQATIIGVWGRATMLGLLYVVFLLSPLALASSGGPVGSADAAGRAPTPTGTADSPTELGPGHASAHRTSSATPSNTPPAGSSVPPSHRPSVPPAREPPESASDDTGELRTTSRSG